MKSIIIAYPIKNTALQIKSVLESEGFYVSHICATGASVLNIAGDMRSGVIVCSSILRDMGAGVLAERLPAGFDIVALSKGGIQSYMGNLISLPFPLDRDEFVNTVAVLVSSESSFTNRKKDDNEYISDAKSILMSVNGMSEMMAHKYLQKESMRSGKKIADVAKEIIKQFS
ncbi:MAG: ANTAR domain-containing response regulator [Eubacterium sp.]